MYLFFSLCSFLSLFLPFVISFMKQSEILPVKILIVSDFFFCLLFK